MKRRLFVVWLLVLLVYGVVIIFRKEFDGHTVYAQTVPVATPIPDSDWPQLQRDPQRSGYSPVTPMLSSNLKFGFASSNLGSVRGPERLATKVQPVVAGKKLFMGTSHGTFYCFNADTLAVLNTYPADGGKIGPIIGTAGVDGGKVFFGSMDGNIYALNTSDCSLAWKYQTGKRAGFSSAVLLAEGKIFIPNRAGVYYAFSQNGVKLWEKNIGEPIFMSSAYNNGRIYFGTMNMNVYAISSIDGSVIFKTKQPVRGSAFKDFWPVVHQGYVIIRAQKVHGDASLNGDGNDGYGRFHYLLPIPANGTAYSEAQLNEQGAAIISGDYSVKNEGSRTVYWQDMYVFKESDWSQVVVPHYATHTMNGPVCPPSVDKEGLLIVPIQTAEMGSLWGRLNLSFPSGPRITHAMTSFPPRKTHINGDESTCPVVGGTKAFLLQFQEESLPSAGWNGYWNYLAGDSGNISAVFADKYFFHNTQGGGAIPGVIANGKLYHTVWNSLNAR